MKYVVLILVSLIGGNAHSANSTFRCVSNQVSAEAGIGHVKKYAGIDLEVIDAYSGLLNGNFASVKPLEVNDDGKVLGQEKTASGNPIHDQLQLIANLSIKTKLYLRINSDGENAGLSRGYIESIWGTKKIFWRDGTGIFIFSYDPRSTSDCTEIE